MQPRTCVAHRLKGTCSNRTVISRRDIESRVLAGLNHKLKALELVQAFIEEFQAETNRAAREADREHAAVQVALSDIARKITSIVRAVEDGLYNSAMKTRLAELEGHKSDLAAALAEISAPSLLRLHPKLPELYRQRDEKLVKAPNAPNTRAKAGEILCSLIDKVILTPRPHGRIAVELYGDPAEILAFKIGRAHV